MDRRTLLKAGVAAGAVGVLAGCTTAPGHPGAVHHPHRSTSGPPHPQPTRSGRPKPPTRSGWSALRDGLDGDLLRPGDPEFATVKRLYDPRFDHIAPAGLVRAASPADVASAVTFAGAHRLPVRPRSGGHSYVGASTAAGGLQLDVSALRGVSYDAGSQTVTVGAGASLFDVHTALDPHARTVPTGTCATVGAGLTLGGGMGVEDAAYGLTCDSLVALSVVTADGRTVEVDAGRSPDLFWACRGGGGGSFGVVTSMRFRTWPAGPTGFYFLTFDDSHAVAALAGWQSRIGSMPRSAWANLHLEASPGGLQARFVGVSLTGDAHAEASAMVAAVGADPVSQVVTSHSHHDGVKLLAGCLSMSDASCHLAPAGSLQRAAFVAGSDVVGRPLGAAERRRLVSFVRQRGRAGRSGVVILDPLVGKVGELGTADTAFPWRSATAVAQWYVSLPAAGQAAAYQDAVGWVHGGHRALRSVSVGGYVNYVEPRRRLGSYYGPNYGRLRQVRARYDPGGLFASPYSVPL